MRMGEGVEWALHCCLNLTWVEDGEAVTATKLARFYGLPRDYLNKQLQALSRAGVMSSVPGPRGGFRLARTAEAITVLDVVVAIEGREPAFRCDQILAAGPGGSADVDYVETCLISQTLRAADLAWRRELASRTIADLKASVEQRYPHTPQRTRDWFLNLPA